MIDLAFFSINLNCLLEQDTLKHGKIVHFSVKTAVSVTRGSYIRFRFLFDSIEHIHVGSISVSVLKICVRTVGSSVSARTDLALINTVVKE